MTARQFGRDSGDTYGRHALVNPGGDNTQRDVLHVVDLGELYARGFRIHPSRIDPAYVGTHRAVYATRSDVAHAWQVNR